MSDWLSIKTRPETGPFTVKTEGGSIFDVEIQHGFEREDGSVTWSYVALNDGYPESWTDGVFWRSNHDDVMSDPPLFWRAIAPQEKQDD